LFIVLAKTSLVSLIVILVLKALLLGFVVKFLFGGNIDEFLFEMRAQPIKLALYFVAFYIVGSVFLFPVSILITAMAYAFTHIWGPLYGLLFVLVWNYFCANIAFSFVFLVSRYIFGDFVYSRVIQNKKFF